MWRELKQDLDIDPPTKMHGGTYLGVTQEDTPPPMALVESKKKQFAFVHSPGSETAQKNDSRIQPMPTEDSTESLLA